MRDHSYLLFGEWTIDAWADKDGRLTLAVSHDDCTGILEDGMDIESENAEFFLHLTTMGIEENLKLCEQHKG